MDYSALVEGILALHRDSVGRAASAVNQTLVVRNWMIGGYLVEFEQKGSDRAAYGQGLLRRLSSDLSSRGVKGSSPDMLERMRLLFRHYPQLAAHISAPAVRIFPMSDLMSPAASISAPLVRKSGVDSPAPLSAAMLLRLSWTHLADLVRIDDPWKRAFYENECLKGNCGDSFACWRPASMTASLFVDKPVRSDACANPRKPCPGAGDLRRPHEMAMRALCVIKHDSELGNAHALFDRVKVQHKAGVEVARSCSDYDLTVEEAGMPAGVSIVRRC